MKRFFLGGLVVCPLFLFACATGGSTGEEGVPDGDGGDGGTSAMAGKGGKGGSSGNGGSTTKGGGAGSGATPGGQGGKGGGGKGGAGGSGAAGTSGKGGGSAGVGGKGASAGAAGSNGGAAGSSAGAGGSAAGVGGMLGTAGSAAGAGGTSAGAGGAHAGSGGSEAGSGGTSAGAGGSGAGAGGTTAGSGGTTAGAGGSAAGSGGSAAGAGGGGPVDACAVALAKLGLGYETGAEGTTTEPLDGQSGTDWPFVQWEVGPVSAKKTTGPTACKTGTSCLANDLDSDYCQCGRSASRTPIWDLTACVGRKVSLELDHWYDFSVFTFGGTTYYDGGLIELTKAATNNVGGTWTAASAAYTGTIKILGDRNGYACLAPKSFHVNNKLGFVGDTGGQWVHEVVPIPTDFLVKKFQARFAWSSGVSYATNSQSESRAHSSAGWYIDNIALSVSPP